VARTVSGHLVQTPGSGELQTAVVPGTLRKVTLVGWALPVMLDFLRRWNAHPALGGGRLSLVKVGPKGRLIGPLDSFAYRPARAADAYSDHCGYAVDIRYDVLKADNQRHMTRAETRAVRELLAEYDGALAWGGDYQRLIDEMHVYVAPGETAKTFAALRLRLRINSDGTRIPKAAKPTKGRTTLTEDTWQRKAPAEHAKRGKLRRKGWTFGYSRVVKNASGTYLVTRFGSYYKAENTTRGA
jgi:hypothetical protein